MEEAKNDIQTSNAGTFEQEQLFWENLKQSFSEIVNLPGDFNSNGLKHIKYDAIQLNINSDLFTNINRLGKGSDQRLFIVLASNLAVLLNKLVQSTNIIVGTSIDRQQNDDNYINTILPLGITLNEKNSFKDVLLNFKNVYVDAIKHQNFPINKHFANNKFFDIAILFDNYQERNYILPSNPNLIFSFHREENQITGKLEYNLDVYSSNSIKRIVDYYLYLLNITTTNINVNINEVSLLTDEAKMHFVYERNKTESIFPKDKSIYSLFSEIVQKYPDRIAIEFNGSSLQYSELDERINRFSEFLKQKRVKRKDIVGLILNQSEDIIVSIMSVLKIGATYLPIDPGLPAERIRYYLEDSNPAICISNLDIDRNITGQTELVRIDQINEYPVEKDITFEPGSGEDPVYIIYTSGTTGRPKGTIIKQSGAINYLSWAANQYVKNEQVAFPLFSSISFDLTVTSVFTPLLTGNKIIIYGRNHDAAVIQTIFKENKVDVVKLTPSHLKLIQYEDYSRSKIKRIIVGGESLDYNLALKIYQNFNENIEIFNEYGPTETVVGSSVYKFKKMDTPPHAVPIGQPINNTQIYLLDNNLNVVPEDILGEIYISGEGVAIGYLNNQDYTFDRFVPNPFIDGQKMYKTGDYGRWRDGGILEFLGRKDNQVKIKGHRVELEEIRAVLLTYPGVDDAIIRFFEEGQSSFICAYIVLSEDNDSKIIEEKLTLGLPAYMVPSFFVKIDQVPLTQNGKVNYHELPKPDKNKIAKSELILPRNEIEQNLLDIWAETLETDKISVEDNFFQIGGDSILSINIISKINNLFNTGFEIIDLYQNDSIAKFANLIKENNSVDHTQKQEKYEEIVNMIVEDKKRIIQKYNLPVKDIEDIYPMSDIEKGMFYLSINEKDTSVYHCQYMMDVEHEDFNIQVFQKAFSLLVDKHQILRTAFLIEDYCHVVYSSIDAKVEYIDLSKKNREEQREYIQDRMILSRNNSFKISVVPLWQATVFKLSNDYNIFLWEHHHAIMDGWNNSSFYTELNNLYIKLQTDSSYIPQKIKASYRDFVIEELLTKTDDTYKKFWKDELRDYKRLNFQKIEETNKVQSFTLYLSELFDDLSSVVIRNNTSMKNLSFAAYAYTTKLLSYYNDFVVGLVTSTRPVCEDGNKILGCLLNTIPINLAFNQNWSWSDYINYIGEKMLNVKRFDKLPLYEIKKIINEKTIDRNPFFDTMFNFINFHVLNKLQSPETTKEIDRYIPIDKHERGVMDLEFNFKVINDELVLVIYYSKAYFNENTIKKIANYFRSTLVQFIKNPHGIISSTNVIAEDEKNTLLDKFQGDGVDIPQETIISLIERQVRETPENIAVISDKRKLTYGEINAKANQLAFHLREKYAIQPNDIVGVLMQKSERLIIAILGILKSGAAYQPIDPNSPRHRIEAIVQDSNSKSIITDIDEYKDLNLSGFQILDFFETEERVQNLPVENPIRNESADDLFYIIYTSGSTGNPKGAMIKNESAVNLNEWYTRTLNVNQEDNFLLMASISFDLAQKNVFTPLLNGAKITLSEEIQGSYSKMIHQIVETKVTIINCAPAAFYPLLDVGINDNYQKLKGVKNVVLGGENINLKSFKAWAHSGICNANLINSYGPTECTDVVSCYCKELVNYDFEQHDSIPIGKPIYNTDIYILDDMQQIQSMGSEGEIYIGGMGVSYGYYNDDDLTNQKFIDNPYRENSKIYRTGDLARWLKDGNIEFFGRIDNQVKIRGLRIELGEVENAMLQIMGIEACVVKDRKDKSEKYLCAYIVTSEELENADIKASLSRLIPDYMIPAHIIQLNEIPLTTNGKIDFKALPKPQIHVEHNYIAPTNEYEERLMKIWSEVLEISENEISIHANFFDCGGNSLNVLILLSKIKVEFDIELSVGEIFSAPTIYTLVQLINGHGQNTDSNIEEMVEVRNEILGVIDNIS